MNAKTTVIALLSAAVLFTAPSMLSAVPGQDKAQKAVQPAPQAEPAKDDAQAKREQFFSIMKEHRSAVQQLRDKLEQKQMELDYLSVNPNVKTDEIKAIIAEISDLKIKMRESRRDLRSKLKDAGFPLHRPKGFRGQPPMHGWNFDQGPRGQFFPPRPDDRMPPPPFGPQDGPWFDDQQMQGPDFGFHHPYARPHHQPMFNAPCGRSGCPRQCKMSANGGYENYPAQEQPYEQAPEEQNQ